MKNQIESSKIELSDEEQYAINQYISPESYILNETLRNELKLTVQQKIMIENLDKALDKMPKYKGITTRSIMLNEYELKEFLKKHRIGSKIKYKAYTSSTIGSRYNELSNVELYIKSKSGRDIRKYNKEEQEVLFKRNTSFKIEAIEKIDNIYHIIMEEINE